MEAFLKQNATQIMHVFAGIPSTWKKAALFSGSASCHQESLVDAFLSILEFQLFNTQTTSYLINEHVAHQFIPMD